MMVTLSMSNARLALALRRLSNGLVYSDDVLIARHHANELDAYDLEQSARHLADLQQLNADAPRDGRDADNEDDNNT